MNVRFLRPSFAAALLAGVLLAGAASCSSPGQARMEAPSQRDEPAEQKTSSEEQSDLEELYWARQDSARSNFTEADVQFMTGMIKHHAQAVVMSRLAPTHGASEQVQTLAARITSAQQDEIATMQRWLRERDQPVPTIEMDGLRLTTNGKSIHGMDMAGVLTERQIQQLDAAQGRTFDRLFLKYMIEHHSGAVTMVDRLVGTDGAAQGKATFQLASEINAAQQTEIARMKRMLDALPPAPGDP